MIKGLPWLIVSQLIATLALLGFAFVANLDEATRTLIVGATIAHWLNESNNLGRQVANGREDSSNSAAPPPAAGG